MDAALFAKMLSDKSVTDLKKLKYKYPNADIQEFVELLSQGFYKTLNVKDFNTKNLVYLESVARVRMSAAKILLTPQNSSHIFGLKAMEDEIASTLTIENIDFSRDSVRKILKGYAPADDSESRIYGMKKGLEFIGNTDNVITQENMYKLYMLAIGDYLEVGDRLAQGNFYRHDSVFIVGQNIEHTGLSYKKLPEYMEQLVGFIDEKDEMNELLKAAVVHFYVAYVHPYFDGNGRMARLMHLWYLVQCGYCSALFVPLSGYIEKSRKKYYDAYTLCERNAALSGVLDVTPFLVYFIENVYNQLNNMCDDNSADFRKALDSGSVTQKEKDLWRFVVAAYGDTEFSTKQLERDYGDVAYATVRSFVIKFEKLGLLCSTKYSNRVKYRVAQQE